MGDMVKHARRKYQVESVRPGGYAVVFDQKIIGRIRIALFAEREAAFGHVARRQRSLRKMRPKERNRIADSGAEVADLGHADAAAIDELPQLPDLIFREILR